MCVMIFVDGADSGSSHHSNSCREGLTAEALQRHSQDQQARQTQSANSKLNNILSFLDEVESGDRIQDIEQVNIAEKLFSWALTSRTDYSERSSCFGEDISEASYQAEV